MIVGGENYSGIFAHASVAQSGSTASGPAQVETAADETRQSNPTYFRSISSVGYGSLAGAYQAIRSMELANVDAVEPTDAPSRGQAILSGAGIPAALAAYGEAMEAEAA